MRDSLEMRQAKIQAVEDYKSEQEQERQNINTSEVSHQIVDVIQDMSLYKEFKNTPAIDQAFVEIDSHMIDSAYDNQYGFDDVKELADLKDKAQSALNMSIGTPVEGLARATFNTITREEGQILADLAFNGESQVF